MKEIIQLTQAAALHIQNVIKRRGKGLGFRISVKKTGCSGYMYVPEVIDVENPQDEKIITMYGLTIYVDKACADMLRGTTLDFVKKNLGQEQLIFNNPNVDSLCGCGESFNLKEKADDRK